jgi:hypothetical protein
MPQRVGRVAGLHRSTTQLATLRLPSYESSSIQMVAYRRCVATLDACAEQLAGAPEQLRELVGIQHQEGQRPVVPRDLEPNGR